MADRYWVGGGTTGLWTDTTNWSATSGGAGGASVPGTGDNITFDTNSPNERVLLENVGRTANNWDFSTWTGTLASSGAIMSCNVEGSFTMGTGVTFEDVFDIGFASSGGTLTFAGKTYRGITFTQSGTTWTFADALTASGQVRLNAGNIDSAGNSITANDFHYNNNNTSTIDFAGSTVTLTGTGTVWNIVGTSNLTSDFSGSTIRCTGAGNSTFIGGGLTYGTLWNDLSSGDLTITGSNTFTPKGGSKTWKHTDGTTTTWPNAAAVDIDGGSGTETVLTGTSTGGWNLVLSSGTLSVSYCDISYSSGTGDLNAPTSNGNIDSGNNSGWVFSSGYTLAADAGSYAITGSAASLTAARYIAANSGSYVITGFDAALNHGFYLLADSGAYDITGFATSLLADRYLAAVAGSYAITGSAAALLKTFLLQAEAGVYTVTGVDAGLSRTRVLLADAGSYAITGYAVSFLRDLYLAAEYGQYEVTGFDASLLAARTIAAESGAYTLTGFDAGVLAHRVLSASPGSYTITGIAVGFEYNLAGQLVAKIRSGNTALTATIPGVSSLTGKIRK